MKKLAVFAVLGLFLSATAFAEVIVLQNGKTSSYTQENVIALSGETSASVSYNGVRIFAPKGKKIQISKSRDGRKILINGTDLEGVELSNGKQFVKLTSQNKSVSVVPDTFTVSNDEGNEPSAKVSNIGTKQAKAVKQNNTANKVKQSSSQQVQAIDFPVISEYVNDVVVQQTAQDVTENPELSPSSPSSN